MRFCISFFFLPQNIDRFIFVSINILLFLLTVRIYENLKCFKI